MTTIQAPSQQIINQAGPSVPHSREAEDAVLGSVLINPNSYYELQPFLKAEHFYIHRNRWIWEAFEHLFQGMAAVDMLTVSEVLNRRKQLEELGGPAYLTKLINEVPNSLNAEHYGRIVHAHAIRREMISAANKIATLAYNQEVEIEDAVAGAAQETSKINILSTSKTNISSLGEVLDDVMEDNEVRAKDPKWVYGIATGFPKYDIKTGGQQLSELTYVVGGPGIGKTFLDLTWSVAMAKQAPGITISLEMKKRTVGRRILSGISGVSTRSMKSGFINEGDWPIMTNAVEQHRNLPLYIDDSAYDTDKLRATLAWMKREHGIKWFILDYALLLRDRGTDETEQTKIISANMKQIVLDLNLSGIVLHSVVKTGMGEVSKPNMADQRGSGQAIHDPDVQLFLTKLYEQDEMVQGLPAETKKKMATLWCTKGRELEESQFKVHLIRRESGPFWGEYSPEENPRF